MTCQTSLRTNLLYRSKGVNVSERFLKDLCDKTFLSLWSYPGLYRDQGKRSPTSDGKEICDLIVVFGDRILLFSDKSCQIPRAEQVDLNWSRWYRKAIQKSAEQIWGAENWIRKHPDRIFLDQQCTIRFPFKLPDSSYARFHRIVVAHDADQSNNTLSIRPDITGDDHLLLQSDGGLPFAVGQIDPQRGFVHVFGDDSLESVMSELDTVSDFVEYLDAKEELISKNLLETAASERDLLAEYRFPEPGKDQNSFPRTLKNQRLNVPMGRWDSFVNNTFRQSRISANRYSYFWDDLIEQTTSRVLDGTQYYPLTEDVLGSERILSRLAAENRFRRRSLSESWLGLVATAKNVSNSRVLRAIAPGDGVGCHYIFLLVAEELDGIEDPDKYREARRNLLTGACEVYAAKNPGVTEIIGLASELGMHEYRSEDLIFLDARQLTPENHNDALNNWAWAGFFTDGTATVVTDHEYPDPAANSLDRSFTGNLPSLPVPSSKGRDRNRPCLCGSGRKTKHCCGQS